MTLTKIGDQMMRNADLTCQAIRCYPGSAFPAPRFHCNAKQNAKKFFKWVREQSSTLACFLRLRADCVTLLLNHTNLQSGAVTVFQSQTQATFSGLTSGHYLTCILCFSRPRLFYMPRKRAFSVACLFLPSSCLLPDWGREGPRMASCWPHLS